MIPLSTLKSHYRWILSTLEKSDSDYNGDFQYEISEASFSDYSGGMVERANSRALEVTYDFVTLDTSGFGFSVLTVIRSQDIWEAISHEKFPDFMEEVDSLSDYPCLDDSILSEIESEAEQSAWNDWICSDLQRAIIKAHGPQWDEQLTGDSDWEHDLETGLEGLTDQEWRALYRDLCDQSGQELVFETGGIAWIDVEKLAESLDYKTLIQVVTGVYFVKPDAIQINFKLEGE